MRENHLKQAHRSNPAQLTFNASNIAGRELEAVLSDMIREDQAEAVQEVLSTSPDALASDETLDRLQLLASLTSSSDMLKLLKAPGGREAKRWHWSKCLEESIKGRNMSTLRYLLSEQNGCTMDATVISELISSDWPEGVGIFCEIESGSGKKKEELGELHGLFGSTKVIQAASDPAGENYLHDIWRTCRFIPSSDTTTLSQALKNVADFTTSITLATYLLDHGANINYKRTDYCKTALQLAARRNSERGAQMIRFLLLKGADPEADQRLTRSNGGPQRQGKRIRDEPGAMGIHQWLGKTWDELVEETKSIRGG